MPLAVHLAHAVRAPQNAGELYFGAGQGVDLGAVKPGHAGQFYQRVLPPAQVPFASSDGRLRFKKALENGTMESFFFLAEQFRTQDEPTFCGLTTLAMVLNSLRIDPMRTWKGAWRWYNEQNLACCFGPERVRAEGLSFDMFSSLARCNGAEVNAKRADADAADAADAHANELNRSSFIADFRNAVRRVSASSQRECLVVCYTREVLGQSGAGHFSPIGGYHEETDSVLIMDVARFKYPPHWVPLTDLADAMLKMDPRTGKSRGFLHLHLPTRSANGAHGAFSGAPFRVPFVPPAAGRRLSEAFAAKLEAERFQSDIPSLAELPVPSVESGCLLKTLPSQSPHAHAHLVLIHRWLSAVAVVEPQVWGQLLQVSDLEAVQEVFARLSSYQPFKDLCEAYALARQQICTAEFPPLRFRPDDFDNFDLRTELTLWSCGELWVLLLLLLPEHMQQLLTVSDSPDLPSFAKGMARAIRGPWALPLEAQRDTLSHILPVPRAKRACGQTMLRHAKAC